MKIYIDTDCNAPCCPCQIVAEGGRNVLVQSDWDYPGFASSFGWATRNVQKCPKCRKVYTDINYHADTFTCEECEAIEQGDTISKCCDHRNTDGTVSCRCCGVTTSEFISAAGDYLSDNDGATAEDPGYFS
jgi:hypothetical protein